MAQEEQSAGTYPMDELVRPAHLDEHLASFVRYASKRTTADQDYKYWSGAAQPWRNGMDDTPVTDKDVIASEETFKIQAEAEEDNAGTAGTHAEKLRGYGVRVDFLLALTFALHLWEWKTWEVVQYLVKPATEGEGRCRFARAGCGAAVHGRSNGLYEPLLGRAVGRPGGGGVLRRRYESNRVVSWGGGGSSVRGAGGSSGWWW